MYISLAKLLTINLKYVTAHISFQKHIINPFSHGAFCVYHLTAVGHIQSAR